MMIYEALENKEGFSQSEAVIADYVLEHPNDLEALSGRELSKHLYVSPSAVTRFAQKIGFEGYNDFRKAFLDERAYLDSHFNSIDPNRPFERTDSDIAAASRIGETYIETVRDTTEMLDYRKLEQASKLLKNSGTIYVASAGSYLQLAEVFREKMARIGKTVILCPHIDIVYHYSCRCPADSVFILISYSGETDNILKCAARLKERGIPSIAVTSYGTNSLSDLSSLVFYMSTRERMNACVGDYCRYISCLYILDVFYSCVFRKDYDENFRRKLNDSKSFQTLRKSANPILKDE